MCGQEVALNMCTRVGKDDPLTGTKEQWRCKTCNNFKSRVTRICGNDPVVAAGYSALEPADRKALIENGGMQIHVQYYNNTKLPQYKNR
jgi:hypothetical protein